MTELPGFRPGMLSSAIRTTALLMAAAVSAALFVTSGSAAQRAHVVATISTGRRPEPVLADAAHHRVYVGNESGATVSVIDDRTNKIVKVVPAAHEMEDLALDPTTGLLYTANRNSKNVSVIDTHGLTRVASISPGGSPYGIAVDSARHRLFVTLGAQGQLAVIDTRTRRVVSRVPVSGNPQGVGVDTSNHRVFVAAEKSSRLYGFVPGSWKVLGATAVSPLPVHPVRVDPATHRVYLLGSGGSQLTVVNGNSMTVRERIPTGPHPEGLDIGPGARFAYVANEGDPGTDKNSGTTASVIDLQRRRVVDTITVPLGPDGVAYDSGVHCLYVASENHGKISVIALPASER